MFNEIDAQEVANDLPNHSVVHKGGFAIARLLVATERYVSPAPWLFLDLEAVVKFISARMRLYARRKVQDRMFFDGDLIQFLAWRGGRDL